MPSLADEYFSALLADELTDEQAQALLAPARLTDWRAARARLIRMASRVPSQEALAACLPYLLVELSHSGNPDQVLTNLERLATAAMPQTPPSEAASDPFSRMAANPRLIQVLVTLFSSSQFLAEILLRNPAYLSELEEYRSLPQARTKAAHLDRLGAIIESDESYDAKLDALRRYQQWEFLRIGTSDLLGLLDLNCTTTELSHLADALVEAALQVAAREVRADPAGLSVVAMGKLGGGELNYSSDIDLLFLCESDSARYFPLAKHLIDTLTRSTPQGFLYRVDMRLRPWGRAGALVSTVDAYLSYLARHARLWERQALIKAQGIAGDGVTWAAFRQGIEPFVYSRDTAGIREGVLAMRRRTEEELRQQGAEWGEVKLGEGSIRDIESVTQYLQLVHGADHPSLRTPNTLVALGRLLAEGLITADEGRVLADGYVFLRTIEHHLQMMHYRQTHRLPTDAEAIGQLARRLGFWGPDTGQEFLARYQQHGEAIRAMYVRFLEEQPVIDESVSAPSVQEPVEVQQHVVRMAPSYAAAFDPEEIKLHAALADQLGEVNLVEIHGVPGDKGRWRVTIVAYDYPGELSLICGLLFVHGLSIVDGHVFTYERVGEEGEESRTPVARGGLAGRKKIVDVFTVEPERGDISPALWLQYEEDLAGLLHLLQVGQMQEAQGELSKRVASAMHGQVGLGSTLLPVDIEIDNELSDRYTVLRIDAPDTRGFLYEFTNALAVNRIYIARVSVSSAGDRVQDVLFVTDENGVKITSEEKQRELRAATALVKHFTHLLPASPNPEAALLHFREFIGKLFQQSDWPNELASLERADVLHGLARLLGVSDFLWNDFLRMQYANLFPVVTDVDALQTAKSRETLQAELETALRPVHEGPQAPTETPPWRETLNAFKDREMFRIDMRHIMGHTKEFDEFSQELSDLAEVVTNSAYHLCHEDLRSAYGTPCLASGEVSEMAVCALGKLGGRELGFASDIELLLVYAGNGQTTGPEVISTAEFYEKLAQLFVGAIHAKREGIFEVDLRLRPYGSAGTMAVSLESFRRYFSPDGPAWAYERQALVKLRPIAGSKELGARIVELRDQYVYTGAPFDVTAMHAMRERQIRHLVTGGTFNAKFSPGGLVDVEYLVQGLQITYGHRDPRLRQTNIRAAMAALAEAGVLSAEDYRRLRRAHTFLRWLIDGLRMVRGNAKDLTVPPADSEGFAFLARRLRYGNHIEQLQHDLALHTAAVQELSAKLLL